MMNNEILKTLFALLIGEQSTISLYSRYYAEACNEFAVPISALLRPSNTASFEEMAQRRVVGNTASDLTSSRFKPLQG